MRQMNSQTPLPDPPERVDPSELIIKEAVGIGLWNGLSGGGARLYLIRMRRNPEGPELIRFPGGTAVPQSTINGWNQSLIRMQQYFDQPFTQEAIVGYTVLHRALYLEVPIFSDSKLEGKGLQSQDEHSIHGDLSHVAVGYETHGVITCDPEFIKQNQLKLVELRLNVHDQISAEPNLPFNNSTLLDISRHILQCLTSGKMICEVHVYRSQVSREAIAPTEKEAG